MKVKIITGPIDVQLTLSSDEAVILNTLLSLTASCGGEATVGNALFEIGQALERAGVGFKAMDWSDEQIEEAEAGTKPFCKLTAAFFAALEDA